MEKIFFEPEKTPLVILAEGCYGEQNTKIVSALVRYGTWPLVAAIDSTRTGRTSDQILGYGESFPVVASLEEAMKYNPAALVIGIAVQGGELPHAWKLVIAEAIDKGLHVINGLHYFLSEDNELVEKARHKNVILWDVRKPSGENRVCKNVSRPLSPKVILTVGSDCSCGKMFTSLELVKQLPESRFLATGQTGILVSGDGIPLDRIIGDFMAGAAEQLVLDHMNKDYNYLVVEGQGSLIHPSFSGVTLALMHGSAPDAMIFCHTVSRKYLKNFDIPIPSINRLIEIYEDAMGFIKPAKVIGISLNCSGISDNVVEQIIKETEEITGLPVVDPVKTGVKPLVDRIYEVL